jgi:predicted secreted protein
MFVSRSGEAATPLSLGTTYSGAIAVPGQTNSFTFTGTPGQHIFFDSLDSDTLPITVYLLSPGGVLLAQQNHSNDQGPWILTEPGTFTLEVFASGATTGNYNFRLLDLSAGAPLPLNSTLSDQLSPPSSCNVYQLNGKRGQRISLQWPTYSTNKFQWQLISPANVVLGQGFYYNYNNLTSLTLPMDGPYSLLVEGSDPGTAPLTFQLLASDISDTPVAASGFGTVRSGNISANVTNSYTYTAPAGLPVYFDNLDASGQSLLVDLLDPTGGVVFSVSEVSDSGPYTLPRSGTYTLNVRGPGGSSGNYNFRLLDLTQSPALVLGASISNSLASPYQTDVYQVSGSAGQRLYYESLGNPTINVHVFLLGPDAQTPINTALYNNQGPLTLASSGTCYLFIQNGLASSSNYRFSIIDAGVQPTLPLDTDLVSTLAINANQLYQLPVTAGQKLYFQGNVNVGGGSWGLFDTRNGQVNSSALGGDFQYTIPYSGNYLVGFFGSAGNVINYSNRVSTITYTTLALTLGSTISNNIVHAGDQLIYTFTGTAGQRLFYDGQNPNSPSIYAELHTPSGLSLFFNNAAYDIGPLSLPQSGTYTLVFSASSHTTGAVMFSLLDLASQPTLPINADLVGALPSEVSQLFTFSATAGEQLYFNSKSVSSGGASWSLYGPNNLSISSANLVSDFQSVIPKAGTYVLVLQNNGVNVITYSNQVNTFTLNTNALSFGVTVTNNLVQPGDQQFYTFNGSAGQRIYIDSLTGVYLNISMYLYSPAGVYIGSANLASDFGPMTLPISGTYLLQIYGSGDTVGPISLRILDLNAQPELPLNSDLVGTLAPNQALVYKVTGTAGEQLYFNAKGGSGNGASWTLFGPNNVQVTGAGNYLISDFEQTLPYGGTYALVLSAGNNPTSYSNQVNTTTYTTNNLTPGAGVFSTLAHPGDQFYYTFSGTTGQRLYYDSRQTNSATIYATLLSPAGATVFSGNSQNDVGPFTLTQSGTYTLVFDGGADNLGDISFQLLDLSAATAYSLGTPINDSLADQTQTRLYKFSGTTGQRLNLQSVSAPSGSTLWGLYGPADQLIGNQQGIGANIGIVTLPATGSYTLAIIGYGTVPAPVPFQVSVTDVSDGPVASTGFGVVNSGNIAASQTNSYMYTASAGTPVYFDSQDASGQNLVVDLMAPDGSAVFFGDNETFDYGPYVLPRSGTYTLNVRGSGGASGNFSFRLLDLSASPKLPLNSVVSGTLSNPYETDIYQITSSPGQSFVYDAVTIDANYPSVFVSMLDPKGQPVGPNNVFQNDYNPFLVKNAGTCYFFIRNNKSVPSSYGFQMLDVAAQPVLPVNSPVTNTIPGYSEVVYKYAGSAGQRLYFQGQPSDPSGYWSLFDPNDLGVSASGASFTGDFEVTLPATGTYTLLLSSSATTASTNVFLVDDFSYITNAYTLGTSISSVIARPGERHVYTFSGTLGQRLYYDALTNDPPVGFITAILYNPEGVQEGPVNSRFSNDRGPFTLSQSGIYTLVIDGSGSGTGAFAFQLLDLAAQPVLPINVAVTNTMNVYPSLVYQYSGTVGKMLYFHGNGNNQSGYWTLYDPNNNAVGQSSLAADFEVTLALPGSYSLVMISYGSTSGPEIFQVNDYSYFTNSYTLGTQLFDNINRPGERRSYTFNGTRGQRLVYNSLTNDPPSPNIITVTLLNPDGGTELYGRFSSNPNPFTLQESGTYTLVVDGQGAGVGAFGFQIVDVATLPVLPTTGGVTNTLGVFAAHMYQYTGTPGEHLYFRSFPSNPSGYWYLYDPNNASVAGTVVRADMQATLSLTGAYLLVIQSQDSAPGTETFQVNPFDYLETPTVNRAPILTHIPDQVLPAGVLVSFSATASDPDNNTLTFSLDPGNPAGASLDPVTGAFTWTPPITGLSSVTPVTIRVTDNGNPPQSDAQVVLVEVIAGPAMISARPTNGVVNVSWHSAPGKHYQIQYKNEIEDAAWQALGGTFTASALISIQVDATTNTHKFYRVQALDPIP